MKKQELADFFSMNFELEMEQRIVSYMNNPLLECTILIVMSA